MSPAPAASSIRIEIPDTPGRVVQLRDDLRRLAGSVERFGKREAADLPRLLVPIDGSPTSAALVVLLRRWREQFGWNFEPHLINVQPFLAREAAEALLLEHAGADTAETRAALDDAGIGFVHHVAMGDPAERILERAAAIEAAIIVIGSRGHGNIGRLLLGSVASKVTQLADCPVTVVR